MSSHFFLFLIGEHPDAISVSIPISESPFPRQYQWICSLHDSVQWFKHAIIICIFIDKSNGKYNKSLDFVIGIRSMGT
jgi:hypothetical protein